VNAPKVRLKRTIAVMQPYFFPYLGYYRLASVVDTFVFFDDVNFIKKGWINRNRIQDKNGVISINIELKKASQNKFINEIYLEDYKRFRVNFLKKIHICYGKSYNFNEAYEFLKELLDNFQGTKISDFNIYINTEIFKYLNISADVLVSSALNYNRAGAGQEKIISICQLLEASKYCNLPGGKDLYKIEEFMSGDLNIEFVEPTIDSYQQFKQGEFISNLSILDYIFFNKKCDGVVNDF
jgi:hypothetical protein